jgi:hypothetical protein
MECKHDRLNASTVTDNPGTRLRSVAVISSRKLRRLQARPVSNASRYSYASANSIIQLVLMSGRNGADLFCGKPIPGAAALI